MIRKRFHVRDDAIMATTDEEFKKHFTELLHLKLGLFRSIASKIVISAEDADDVVQTALLKACVRRNKFHGDAQALSGWICRIIINESYDLLRKRAREERKLADWPIGGGNVDPELRKLDSAIASLPELYRDTVHIAILSNLSGEEAARQMGCSANTLYQRIHKAKSLLKKAMRRMKDE